MEETAPSEDPFIPIISSTFSINGTRSEITASDVLGDFEFVSVPASGNEIMEPEEFDPLTLQIKEEQPVAKNTTVTAPPPTKIHVSKAYTVGHGARIFFTNVRPAIQNVIQTSLPFQMAASVIATPSTSKACPPPEKPQLKAAPPQPEGQPSILKRQSSEPIRFVVVKKFIEEECLHCKVKTHNLIEHLNNEECFTPILKCSICQRIFNSEKNYNDHFVGCSAGRITCDFCYKIFSSNYLFAYHWYHSHQMLIPKDQDCQHCSGHCQLLVGNKPKCTICCTEYANRKNLMKHLFEIHMQVDVLVSRVVRKRLTCQLCYTSFGSFGAITSHYLRMACSFKRCNECLAVFKDQDSLTHHSQVCHADPTVEKCKPGFYHECQHCDPQKIVNVALITFKQASK